MYERAASIVRETEVFVITAGAGTQKRQWSGGFDKPSASFHSSWTGAAWSQERRSTGNKSGWRPYFDTSCDSDVPASMEVFRLKQIKATAKKNWKWTVIVRCDQK